MGELQAWGMWIWVYYGPIEGKRYEGLFGVAG